MTLAGLVRHDISPAGRRVAMRATLAAAALVFVALQLVLIAPHYRQAYRDFETQRPALGGSDFPAFYMGARLMLSSDRGASYDEETQGRTIVRIKGFGNDLSEDSDWYRYYNPPVYSLLLAPLGLLPLRIAYVVAGAANLVALAGLAWLVGSILRWRQPLTACVLFGLAGSLPVLYAFWHAQPGILLALILGGSFLLGERSRPGVAGAVLALASIKPQWLAIPGLALLRLRPGSLRAFGAVLFLMGLPFLLVGVQGTLDFVALVRGRGYGDVHDDGFAEALLSWSGFLRAYTGHVRPDWWLLLSALTAVAFVPIWLSRDRDLLPLAAVLATLLIGPHSHPQDWLLVVPAACFMLRRQSGYRLTVSAFLLTGMGASLNSWTGLSEADRAVYWPTIAGAFALLWLDFLAIERLGATTRTGRGFGGRVYAGRPFASTELQRQRP